MNQRELVDGIWYGSPQPTPVKRQDREQRARDEACEGVQAKVDPDFNPYDWPGAPQTRLLRDAWERAVRNEAARLEAQAKYGWLLTEADKQALAGVRARAEYRERVS